MGAYSSPSFDEWARYCFEQAYGDTCGGAPGNGEGWLARQEQFLGFDAVVLTGHLTRLFESPAFAADRYSTDQIAGATCFIFGISGYLHEVRSDRVPQEAQVRCYESLITLYTNLFDRACGAGGADLDADPRNSSGLDGAVYGIWDMDGLSGPLLFPEKNPCLVEPSISALGAVLQKCRTSACLTSALHGMGHAVGHHNYCGDETIATRLQLMINDFMDSRELPEWLSDYAVDAKRGRVL